MAAVNIPARSFVNTIVSGYDTLCHRTTAKIPDIFNPGLEKGLKESSLELFLENFSNPPLDRRVDPPPKMTDVQLDAQVIASYKASAPNLSHLFALTGMLDAPSQDGMTAKGRVIRLLGLTRILGGSTKEGELQKAKERIIETLAQDHLRSKQDYALDPMAEMMMSMSSSMAETMGQPEPLAQFADGKSHFYSQIFLEVYCRSASESRRPSALTKRKIVALLKDFQPQLDSPSFRLQRVVFKIERTFNSLISNRYVKFGFCAALGIGSYFAVYKVIAISGVFFNSAAFAAMSSGVVRYMPVVVVQISSGAYTRIVGVVSYVASTRLYQLKIGPLQFVPIIICKIVPIMNWVIYPVATFAGRVRTISYERAFGPSARVRVAIAESLKICKDPKVRQELLEEGMKAYQVWMYLVEQGPQKGLFEAVPTH